MTEMLQYHFGLKPRWHTYMYQTPYPHAYDHIPIPPKYKALDFTKFSRQDDTSTIEHINRFIIQCGEVLRNSGKPVTLETSSLTKFLRYVFQGKGVYDFQESGTCEASGSRTDFQESWTCEASGSRTCDFRESWICEVSES
jgi:hypothetical protein